MLEQPSFVTKWGELSAWKIRPLDHMGGMTPFGASCPLPPGPATVS